MAADAAPAAAPAHNPCINAYEDEYNPKLRWVIPQRVEQMSFIGRDVLALVHDMYILFLNVRTGLETTYAADGPARGDGVDAIAGYKSNMFVFAEKVKNARIFVMMYPALNCITELKDTEVNRYKALCLMEGELVAGFSGFPNYLVTVWSWRSGQRLLALPTGVLSRNQLYVASRSHMTVCEVHGGGLVVWEVAPAFRRCFMLRRGTAAPGAWDVAPPPFVAAAWAHDGQLHVLDAHARFFSVSSDSITLFTKLEWSDEALAGVAGGAAEGAPRPALCALGPGFLLYGPDTALRWLKKTESNSWRLAWTYPLPERDEVLRLVGSAGAENAVAWTRAGRVLRVTPPAPPAAAQAHAAGPAAAAGRGAARGRARARRGGKVARSRRAQAADAARVAEAAAAAAERERDAQAAEDAAAAAERAVPEVHLVCYKQRHIIKIKLIAPEFAHIITLNDSGEVCIYELMSAKLVVRRQMGGTEPTLGASPTEPLLAVVAAAGDNYGVAVLRWHAGAARLERCARACLTHQPVSRVVFSPSGRQLMAAAMAAGHLFIYSVSEAGELELVRYAEVGRGLADCLFMKVGPHMRAFALVLFSDKFLIGERIVCINAETGKDNKFAGKMAGPYARLAPLSAKDSLLAVPYLSTAYHVLRLAGEKGVTVSVKMGPIIESGHGLKQFGAARGLCALLTYGADGLVVLRRPDAPPDYELMLTAVHRYEGGVKYAAVDSGNTLLAHLGYNRTLAVTALRPRADAADVRHEPPPPPLFTADPIPVLDHGDKNYLQQLEERKVREEALDYKQQREEVVRVFRGLQAQLVALLEENIAERPLHQLSLSEFNLHMEMKRERLKAAEREREEIRLGTEARIRAQDKVTAWIKRMCWDSMLTPRVKIFAIFSHYQVENYPVLPTQREQWPELQLAAALRYIEMEKDADVFRPWEERALHQPSAVRVYPSETGAGLELEAGGAESAGQVGRGGSDQQQVQEEEVPEGVSYVLSGTAAHKYVTVPPYMIPQTLAFSFLQMNWLHQIAKFNVQNVRLWFNKQFDELMAQKKREVGLVCERNARLRFILEELNKLSDLRGSFHHLLIVIKDPEWQQEEQPLRLTKVEVKECTISPWASHVSLPPPEPKPKSDFKERALMEMMDGVLEKLWHEEIKKPIPKPQCMLDKEPEHWNEEDLRQVFDYEAKVKFREGEREKYRRMLHAEYAKLSQVLNEGIVKFNMKVKDLWLMKLRVDSVIGQENLNLMRLRRVNLDRVEAAEGLEALRVQIKQYEEEAEELQRELDEVVEQSAHCQAAYDALAARDRQLDRTFKNHFADFSPIVVDQCYKFFKKRPKFVQRASMIPAVLYELAGAVGSGVRPPLLHPDCQDYFKGVEQLDLVSNMPPVLDEALWATTCRLRRAKIENEMRMRAQVLETANVDNAATTWMRALAARRGFLSHAAARLHLHRDLVHDAAVNRTLQLVLPAGQVEIEATGHIEDFHDATLIPREDIEAINRLILRVGEIKLRLLRRQIQFRKAILQKEWEHAQMKMKLRHMEQELFSYTRLKLPKELQKFLKDKEKGMTDEDDYKLLEKEMAATKMMIEGVLEDSATRAEDLQVKISLVEQRTAGLDALVEHLHLKVSEKRLNEDALEPIRVRRIFTRRMETLVARSALIRQVQAQHTRVVLLQTELELLRLKTFPTLAAFRTIC